MDGLVQRSLGRILLDTSRSSQVLQLLLKGYREPQQGLIEMTSDLLCQRIILVTMRKEEKRY